MLIPIAANFAVIIPQDHLLDLTLSLHDSPLRGLTLPGCGGVSQSNSPGQPTWGASSHFCSVSPTFRSKFFSIYSGVVQSPATPQTIKQSPPSGFPSHRCAAHGGLSPTPIPLSGPSSHQISTFSGSISCNSAPGLCYLMSTFASVAATSMNVK